MKYILPIIATFLFIACSVDRKYDLKKDVNMEMKVGQQVQVPLGNLGRLRIKALLSKEAKEYFTKDEESNWIYDPKGEVLTNFTFGHYKVAGLSFINLKHFHIPYIRFHMTLINTLPFDYTISAFVIDTSGNRVPDISAFIEAHLPAGSEEAPGIAEADLNLSTNQIHDGFGFDGISIQFTSPRMPLEAMYLDRHLGIGLNKVSIQLPEGIVLKIKKTNTNDDDE